MAHKVPFFSLEHLPIKMSVHVTDSGLRASAKSLQATLFVLLLHFEWYSNSYNGYKSDSRKSFNSIGKQLYTNRIHLYPGWNFHSRIIYCVHNTFLFVKYFFTNRKVLQNKKIKQLRQLKRVKFKYRSHFKISQQSR